MNTFITKCKGCGCPLHSSTTTGVCSETCAREVAHLARARYLGADAALTSVVDHYTMSAYEARAYLSPEADDRLSPYPPPELVEWEEACDETLRYQVNPDAPDEGTDIPVAVATAWEEGRDEVWSDALQATALRVLGDTQTALELERDIGNRVDALRIKAERSSL